MRTDIVLCSIENFRVIGKKQEISKAFEWFNNLTDDADLFLTGDENIFADENEPPWSQNWFFGSYGETEEYWSTANFVEWGINENLNECLRISDIKDLIETLSDKGNFEQLGDSDNAVLYSIKNCLMEIEEEPSVFSWIWMILKIHEILPLAEIHFKIVGACSSCSYTLKVDYTVKNGWKQDIDAEW